MEVGKALEGLARPKLIDCFVSGSDISAGMDWRREIRNILAKSHLLVLLYTAPSRSWDWCLYETGLYTRFDRADKNEVSSVVCLFNPGQASPSAIADLQGVPAETDKVRDFLNLLCRETWKISDDWRRGALAPDVKPKQVDDAARAIERAFRRFGIDLDLLPCHRVVLSLSEYDKIVSGIPERIGHGRAKRHLELHAVVVRPGQRSRQAYVGRSGASRARVQRAMAQGARQHFLALKRGTLLANQGLHARRRQERAGERLYRPILYNIVRGPAVGPVSDVPSTPTRGPAP